MVVILVVVGVGRKGVSMVIKVQQEGSHTNRIGEI